MSIWKDSNVKIIHAYKDDETGKHFGLGNDSKLYEWSIEDGAWKKHWKQADKPSFTEEGTA